MQSCNDIQRYKNIVYQFVHDASFSPQNEDDVRFFKYLILETSFGKVHIYLYIDVIRQTDELGIENAIPKVVRYMAYLSQISDAFFNDAIHSILDLLTDSNQSWKAIDYLLAHLEPESRLKMLNIVHKHFPEAISKSPKIKLYTIFS